MSTENTQKIHSVCSLVQQHLSLIPSVTKIWIFGRAARGETLDFRSDIDFAVEGLPAELHGRLWSEMDGVSPIQIDLVRWEESSEALRDQIREGGRIIYERKSG